MSGITSGVGIFSGIDSRSIIDQLLAIEARPRDQARGRAAQLQLQQAAFLDINSRILAIKTASSTFRTSNTFRGRAVASSDEAVLKATASSNAATGTYQFIVDRLVSTQQLLSRGFADSNSSALGATTITLESAKARLDRDVALADLNDGQGIQRGRFTITDSTGAAATIDLSRATSVDDVLKAINQNGTARVQASVSDGRFVLKDTAGGAAQLRVSEIAGATTAASLGIAGNATGTLTGSTVYRLGSATTLASLGDGRGVSIRSTPGLTDSNFSINVGGTNVLVNIGDIYQNINNAQGVPVLTKTQGAVSSVGGVISRINAALDAAGFADVDASIDAENGRLRIVDAQGTRTISVIEGTDTTASDLGLTGVALGTTYNGRRILAGLNTTLAQGINGGQGITGDGDIGFTLRDGSIFSATIARDASLNDVMRSIESQSSGRVRVDLNNDGTGLRVTDLTSGTGNLIIEGTTSADTALSLGISTGPAGVASSSFSGANVQRQYISRATLLSSLNNGAGIGTGEIRIVDARGTSSNPIVIDNSRQTVGDLLQLLNSGSTGVQIEARINDRGDGIEIRERGSPPGANKIKIEDVSGTVAKSLNIAGTAAGTGAQNRLDGSFERTVTFAATDTLQQVTDKINQANAGVSASVIRDGAGSTPFRLNLTASASGTAGRFIITSGGLDLGLNTIDAGNDARLFFGGADPSRGVAVTSSTNQIDGLIPGVKIDAKSVSATPVTLSVTSDVDSIVSQVKVFIEAFNTAITRIDVQTNYDEAADKGGPLLGDSTALELRGALFRLAQGPVQGASGRYTRLTDVGVKVGSGGKLELDESKFRTALSTDFASVETLFVARDVVDDRRTTVVPGVTVANTNPGTTFSRLGIMGQFEQLGERYTTTVGGVLTNRNKGFDDQVNLQRDRIEAFNTRLERRRGILERQFAAMESAIARLQTQSSSLGSIRQAG